MASVPTNPIKVNKTSAVRFSDAASHSLFKAIFCAVERITTVGTPAAVNAKTGEYNPYAVEK